jgi:hypothetical protein
MGAVADLVASVVGRRAALGWHRLQARGKAVRQGERDRVGQPLADQPDQELVRASSGVAE